MHTVCTCCGAHKEEGGNVPLCTTPGQELAVLQAGDSRCGASMGVLLHGSHVIPERHGSACKSSA